MRKYKSSIFILIFFLIFLSINIHLKAETFKTIYEIADFNIKIVGGVSKERIINYLCLKKNEKFNSENELKNFMDKIKSELISLNVFSEVSVDYKILNKNEVNNKNVEIKLYKVQISIFIKEGWTLYPIPFYSYSSDYGNRFGFGFVWFNVFSTLNPIAFEFFIDNKQTHFYSNGLIRLDYKNSLIYAVGYDFSTVENIENDILLLKYTYNSLFFKLGYDFPLIKQFYLVPYILINYNYGYKVYTNINSENISDSLLLKLILSFGFNNTLYNENYFINGVKLNINPSLEYRLFLKEFGFSINGNVSFYLSSLFYTFKGRIIGFYSAQILNDLADDNRAILSSYLWGKYGFTSNIDVQVLLFDIKNWFKFKAGLFYDLTYVINLNVLKSGPGLTIIILPYILKGINIVFYAGFDITNNFQPKFVFKFNELY